MQDCRRGDGRPERARSRRIPRPGGRSSGRGLRRAPEDLERLVRPQPGRDRPLRRSRGRDRRGQVRPGERPACGRPERRPLVPRLLRRRRRTDDRPLADEGRPGRSRAADRARAGRRPARRARPRDAGVRPRGPVGHRHPHRRRRPHPRRRDRLDHAQARPLGRPAALGRPRHGRGRVRARERGRERRPLLGRPRRRRQLRDRDRVRVPLRPARHAGPGRTDHLADDQVRRRAPFLPRLGRRGA